MQQVVKRVFVVVALFTDLAQSCFKGLSRRRVLVHSSISIPPAAISHPWTRTSARSGASGCRMGFVLLMCLQKALLGHLRLINGSNVRRQRRSDDVGVSERCWRVRLGYVLTRKSRTADLAQHPSDNTSALFRKENALMRYFGIRTFQMRDLARHPKVERSKLFG